MYQPGSRKADGAEAHQEDRQTAGQGGKPPFQQKVARQVALQAVARADESLQEERQTVAARAARSCSTEANVRFTGWFTPAWTSSWFGHN